MTRSLPRRPAEIRETRGSAADNGAISIDENVGDAENVHISRKGPNGTSVTQPLLPNGDFQRGGHEDVEMG